MSWGIKNATSGAPVSGRRQQVNSNGRSNARSRRGLTGSPGRGQGKPTGFFASRPAESRRPRGWW